MKVTLRLAAILSLCATPSLTFAAWQRLVTDGDPVESSTTFAHTNSGGASIVSSKGIGKADGLVSHDPTVPATLEAGRAEVVINLGHQEPIHGVSFVNDGVEGKVSVSASPDKKNWMSLGTSVFSPADRHVDVEFAPSQNKYIKVSFELSKGGTVRDFQVFGNDVGSQFKLVPTKTGTGPKINLADGIGGTKVVYIHPSPTKDVRGESHRVDHQPFEFPESDEKYRTVIYDLGAARTVSEFGSVHSPRPVRLEVYAFDQLPEKQDWRGHMTFDPKAFDSTKPVATAEDSRGVGYIKVKTQKPVKTRFVALRWEPDFNPPAFTVYGANIATNDYNAQNTGGGGGGNGGNGGGNDQNADQGQNPGDQRGGPADNTQWGGGSASPFSFSTGGYAGGGGSLPSGSSNGNANGTNNGNANGTNNGNANGNANGTTVQSP